MEKRKFCPNCGSDWVEPDTSNKAEIAFSGGDPNTWQCNECGYTGIMPEGDPDEENQEEEIEFQHSEDVSRFSYGFGRAYAKYLIYILIPAMIIYALFRLLV